MPTQQHAKKNIGPFLLVVVDLVFDLLAMNLAFLTKIVQLFLFLKEMVYKKRSKLQE